MATRLKVGSRVINLDAIPYMEQGSTTLNVHFVGTDNPLALNMGTDRALLASVERAERGLDGGPCLFIRDVQVN